MVFLKLPLQDYSKDAKWLHVNTVGQVNYLHGKILICPLDESHDCHNCPQLKFIDIELTPTDKSFVNIYGSVAFYLDDEQKQPYDFAADPELQNEAHLVRVCYTVKCFTYFVNKGDASEYESLLLKASPRIREIGFKSEDEDDEQRVPNCEEFEL